MKIRRFCLSAFFALIAFASNMHAAALSESGQPFPTALATPEVAGFAFARVAIWLGAGAVLGWMLLSACVAMQVRQEHKLGK
ncbi:MAG: hypothetical protein IPM98_00275 [Lewinellaceae bacterium]|nr:hypothetical protein [Lewinellaceae bacterium]